MPAASIDRVKWHECVIDLLSRSEAIADRDDDGRAVYYLFGWGGAIQFIDDRGHLRTTAATLGSVRMDGFSLLTKADLPSDRTVVARIESPQGVERCIHARTVQSEPAARHGRAVECAIIDQPRSVAHDAVQVRVAQSFD